MERINTLYSSYYGCLPDGVEALTGSASNRRYYRLTSPAGSCIAVIGTDFKENQAFITIARNFREKGISVPEVYAVSPDGMAYIQEDLGNQNLYEMLVKARRSGEGLEQVEELLCRTMSRLAEIQFEGAPGLDFSVCYPQPSFDRRMVMFDLNYFKYCFLKASGLEFNEVPLQDDFERFADDLLADETDTFMYRDFNVRNVMVHDDEPYFIDFQGGRRGPIYYDVASFVWQARAEYTDEFKQRLVDAYLDTLARYAEMERADFDKKLKLFVLFRLLQVLGAYGFRGWTEGKAAFITSIPQALSSLKSVLKDSFDEYPCLKATLSSMLELPRFNENHKAEGLEVKVYSFSFKKGIPHDPSGNGGGYVYDCRSIHNPGRYEPYKKLTGRDEAVIRFLEDDGEILNFLEHIYAIVDPHVETYSRRGFTNLMICFGCTGGQHRSVYSAEHVAHHIAEKYPDVRVRIIHREQNIDEIL